MTGRHVSMEDVARHVGLSRSTVSFVINGRSDIHISEDSRRRVWDAVRELGFRPNATARALASNRTHLVGLITDITTSPFAGGIIGGAQRAAWLNGAMLLIVASDGDASVDERAVEMFLERRVEGLIYATQAHREVRLPDAALEVPIVLAHCFDSGHDVPSVVPDEVAGGYAATRRLLDAGHQRIALINLDPRLRASSGRQLGYEQALAEAGIPMDPRLILSGHATATGGFESAVALFELDDPPTGFFCGNDRMAMGTYDAVKERGLTVGTDIGVVGFDNQEIIAAYLRPQLTTVALPFEAMGEAAIRMLGALAGRGSADSELVPCPLVERASV